MMGNNTAEKYWELLNLFEDYLEIGIRREHGKPGKIRIPGTTNRNASAGGGGEGSSDFELARIAEEVKTCTRCPLHSGRNLAVPGAGVAAPVVMVIGEGPGGEEDRTGQPFVGKAGRYLDKWLNAIELDRSSNCFIGNTVKCRPPGNRDPLPEESAACLPYLEQQVDILKPKVILTVGRIAIQVLTGKSQGIGALRGGTYEYRGIPVIPTYHPSGVLRNPEYRAPVWDDLKRLKDFIS